MKMAEVLMNLKIVNECECDSVLVSRQAILGLCVTLDCDSINSLPDKLLDSSPPRQLRVSRLIRRPKNPENAPQGLRELDGRLNGRMRKSVLQKLISWE